MDFGFSIPTRGPQADHATILGLTKRGEALGFNYVAIPDHIVIPRRIASLYPYTQDRKMAGADHGNTLEPLALMAYLAAATARIRLLTSVLVVPHRPPVLAAKMIATIDVLSGGRVTIGCGAGWLAEEFEAIGAPPFKERGKVTDEYLAIFKALWTEEAPRFAGTYAKFDDISFLPKPVQQPHPPLWIGGESPAAIRRVARFGDAWYPIAANPEFPLNSKARYLAAVGKVRAEAERIGRDPSTIELALWANWPYEGDAVKLDDGSRKLFTGGLGAVAEDVGWLKEAGVRHCLFFFVRPSLSESIAAMEHFAEAMMPRR